MNIRLNIWRNSICRQFVWFGMGDFEFTSGDKYIHFIKILFDIRCNQDVHVPNFKSLKSKIIIKTLVNLPVIRTYRCGTRITSSSNNEISKFLNKIKKDYL